MAGAERGQIVDGRFELLRRLGRGGMGTVWCARDLALHREVALKEVRPPEGAEHVPPPEVLRERVLREARALARLNHPQVVRIYHIVDVAPHPWLVMEMLPGQTLHARARRGPVPVADAVRWGRDILAALRAAHAAGIHHRDVKPANVLLREDDSAVLTDFGIAAVADTTSLTATGGVIGSPEFLAPERVRSAPDHPSADFWSLGITLYVLTEGHSPLRRADTLTTLTAVLEDPIPPPVRSGPLAGVLRALLDRDPAARPDAATLDAMLLEAARLAGAPMAPAPTPTPAAPATQPDIPWSPPPPATPPPSPPTPTPAATPQAPATTADQRPAAARRRGPLIVALIAAALVIALLTTWLLLPDDDPSPRADGGTPTAPPAEPDKDEPEPEPETPEPPPSPIESETDPEPEPDPDPEPSEQEQDPEPDPEPEPSEDPAPDPDPEPTRPTGRWVTQLFSEPVSTGTATRDQRLAAVRADAPEAQVLRSDDYASLNPGYWVIYSPGPFADGHQAIGRCAELGLTTRNACVGRYLSQDPADIALICAPDGSGGCVKED
ncbi:serine/threonine-protein kinase [Streptomyces sp. NBRC 109706]|uniref:serine/threonine-protein kinase n=1 Tax=Streptomyces sp. NBRC 109706 TaxID=1550035 RepID=UPI0007825F35|nr:serine/threonine-protein kinase [Streptomyces sp. NBRC 109706]